MSTTLIDNIDWLKYMRLNATGEPELFDKDTGFPDSWVKQQCRKAALLCMAECPNVYAAAQAASERIGLRWRGMRYGSPSRPPIQVQGRIER